MSIAASSDNHEGEHHFNWNTFLGKTFNSTVLFGGLIILLRKPLIKFLSQKSLDVKNDIIHREELLERTSKQLDQIKDRLDRIENEVASLKDTAAQKGAEEQQRIQELGEKEAQHILEITETEINAKVENSLRRLKEKIADLTIDHFKKEIQTQLDPSAHHKIIEKNIDICGAIIERE